MLCLECKRLRQKCPTCRLVGERDRLKRENATLRSALEPFVRFIVTFDAMGLASNDDVFYVARCEKTRASLRLSEFRTAREALASLDKKEGE